MFCFIRGFISNIDFFYLNSETTSKIIEHLTSELPVSHAVNNTTYIKIISKTLFFILVYWWSRFFFQLLLQKPTYFNLVMKKREWITTGATELKILRYLNWVKNVSKVRQTTQCIVYCIYLVNTCLSFNKRNSARNWLHYQ